MDYFDANKDEEAFIEHMKELQKREKEAISILEKRKFNADMTLSEALNVLSMDELLPEELMNIIFERREICLTLFEFMERSLEMEKKIRERTYSHRGNWLIEKNIFI